MCLQLLFSFSQFTVPVNESQVRADQDAVSLLMDNPGQFLVLQFAATAILTNLQVSHSLGKSRWRRDILNILFVTSKTFLLLFVYLLGQECPDDIFHYSVPPSAINNAASPV